MADELVPAIDRYPNGHLRFEGHNLDGEMHGVGASTGRTAR